MKLLDLPRDVLLLVLKQTVVTVGLYDPIKLRLVCRMRPKSRSACNAATDVDSENCD